MEDFISVYIELYKQRVEGIKATKNITYKTWVFSKKNVPVETVRSLVNQMLIQGLLDEYHKEDPVSEKVRNNLIDTGLKLYVKKENKKLKELNDIYVDFEKKGLNWLRIVLEKEYELFLPESNWKSNFFFCMLDLSIDDISSQDFYKNIMFFNKSY
jgi:hypothetical protein